MVVLVFCACLAPFYFSAKGTHNASPSLCEQVEQEQLLQSEVDEALEHHLKLAEQRKVCAQVENKTEDKTEEICLFLAKKGTGVQIFHARCLFAPPGGRNTRKTPNFRKRDKSDKRKGEKGHRGTDFSREMPFRTARRKKHPERRQIFAKEKTQRRKRAQGYRFFTPNAFSHRPAGRNTQKTPNFPKREKRKGEKGHRGTDFLRQMPFRTARRTKHPKDAKFSQKRKTQRRKRAQGYRFFTPNAFSHRPADETPERRQIFAKEKNAKAKKGRGIQIFYAKCLFAPPGGRNTRKTPNFRKGKKRKGETPQRKGK